MMKTLKAPAGVLSASVMGKPVEIVDGVCEVQDNEAAELEAHGFTVFAAGSAADPRPPAEGNEMSPLDVSIAMLGRAERPELFAVAKSMGVALTATMKTEAMRDALIAETRKAFEANDAKRNANDVKKPAADDGKGKDDQKPPAETGEKPPGGVGTTEGAPGEQKPGDGATG